MNQLTNKQLSLLPTQEEIEQFRQRGWYISKPIISESEIEQVLLGVQRHYKGERDTVLSSKVNLIQSLPNNFRYDSLIVQQNQQIGSLTKNLLIGCIASLLVESSEIRLFTNALANKYPQRGDTRLSVGWHADGAYYKTCTSEKMITAWIPLQDCDEKMGTPIFLEGSHLQSNIYIKKLQQERKFLPNDSEFAELQQLLDAANHSMKIVKTHFEKGQCCFIDPNVLHYTGPNVSSNPRIAVVLFLQSKNNHYRQAYDQDGNLVTSMPNFFCRRLLNGNPDYTDPNFFPILWSS